MNTKKKKIAFWLNNARTTALPQSVMPTLLSISVAWYYCRHNGVREDFSLWLALAALIGVVCAHLCTNLLDDYFDYKNAGIEERERLNRAGMRARMGKAPYLAEGTATLKQTFQAASVFALIAVVMGAIVCLYRGWPVLVILGLGAFFGYFYSAKPIALCYRGLGELDTGLMFGPLLMSGTFVAACGHLTWGFLGLSVAIGLLVTNIVYTHAIMDADADLSVGKHTLATMLGTQKRQMVAEWIFNFLPYVVVVACVAMGLLPLYTLVVLAVLPFGVALFKSMQQFYVEKNQPQADRAALRPKPWMGNMENWDAIVAGGVDWFMFRWYLARNHVTFFSLVFVVLAFVMH